MDRFLSRRSWCLGALSATALMLVGCSAPNSSSGGGGHKYATVQPQGEALPAPDADLVQSRAPGQKVEPTTGLSFNLSPGAAALTPESLGDGRAAVTYVWKDPQAWGYLVVEGPQAFDTADQKAAQSAAHAEQQELIAAGLLPSEPKTLTWGGFQQACAVAWNQTTLPPGWTAPTSVDAIELLLINEAGQSYRLVAYGPRDGLVAGHPAWDTLCGVGSEQAPPSASASATTTP